MIDANDLLNAVTNDLVIEIMDENGSPLYDKSIDLKTNQECLWFRTICHGGDSHKLCYFTKSKDFYCYTNCGRMPFFEFIKKIRGFSDGEFYECLKYVGEKIGYNFKANRYGIGESREQKIRNNESKVIESIKIVTSTFAVFSLYTLRLTLVSNSCSSLKYFSTLESLVSTYSRIASVTSMFSPRILYLII